MSIHLQFFMDRDSWIWSKIFTVIQPYYGELSQANPVFHGGGWYSNGGIMVSGFRQYFVTFTGLWINSYMVDFIYVLYWRVRHNDTGLSTWARNASYSLIHCHGKQPNGRRFCAFYYNCSDDLVASGSISRRLQIPCESSSTNFLTVDYIEIVDYCEFVWHIGFLEFLELTQKHKEHNKPKKLNKSEKLKGHQI